MPDEGEVGAPGGRFLIAAAVSRYPKAPQWDVPELAESRERVIGLFTGLGYHHVSDLGLDPTKDQLTEHLRGFCRSEQRRADDVVAVYIAGHGHVLEEGGEHVILTSDADPDDLYNALPTADLARKMLLGTRVRRLLLLLDTCYSGEGANALAAAALTRMTRQWQSDPGSGFVVVSAAQPDEEAEVGSFPRLLTAAVGALSAADTSRATLAIDAVVQAMNGDPDKRDYHTITFNQGGMTGLVPLFLPNPAYVPTVAGPAPPVLPTSPPLAIVRRTVVDRGRSETTEIFLYSDAGVRHLIDSQNRGGPDEPREAS